jgi:putative oxidoreductase
MSDTRSRRKYSKSVGWHRGRAAVASGIFSSTADLQADGNSPSEPVIERNIVNRQVAPPVHNFWFSLERWAAIPLRLIVGYGFIAHGYAKIARGPVHFIDTLNALGVPWPELMGWMTILIEVVGGFAVLIGALIPLVSVPLAAILLVAAVTVHLPYGFSSIKLQSVTKDGPQFGKPGYETSLLYLAGLATLVLGGPGPLAAERLVGGGKEKRPLNHE